MLKPMKPSQITNEELEQWFLVLPSEVLKDEIVARIDKGEKFPCLKVVQYWGGRVLMPVSSYYDLDNKNKEDIQNWINDRYREARIQRRRVFC